ncbi:hypothetical protein C8Q73DRAFT_793565 [Cubamyces lactineus]|nr:hypothetical protein C8Q73DRAFT_793565 [Cubamyces lactineus]
MAQDITASTPWSSGDWNAQTPVDDIMAVESGQPRTIPCDGILTKGGPLDNILPDDFDYSRVECGLLTVPLDWTRPYKHKPDQLHYAKYRAAPDAVRKGSTYRPTSSKLGPAFTADLQILSTAPRLHNGTGGRFDLVFWTPRGYPGRASITTPGHNRCFDSAEDRDEFYRQASKELGMEPGPWGERVEYLRARTAADAQNWLRLQSRMVETCIARQRATECSDTVLRYVGTAATVRDMVAMADAFDGPGSAVHFWGTESGARIGAYLLQSRVILEAPQDLEAYLYDDLYEVRLSHRTPDKLGFLIDGSLTSIQPQQTWKRELQHAHETLRRFVEFCVENDEQDCSRYMHDEVLDNDRLGRMELSMFSTVRTKYMGWRNALRVDLDNALLASAFKGPTMFGNASFDAVAALNTLQHIEHIDGLDLGMMPVFCGDHTAEYSPEGARERTREIAEMLEEDIHLAPLFSSRTFPSLNYLCHLWPVRAAERVDILGYSFYDVPHPLAAAPLVIQYAAHPVAPRAPLSNVVPTAFGHVAREIVQMKLGLPSYNHKTCLSDVINDYLREGKLPERSVCYGDPALDDATAPAPAPTGPPPLHAQPVAATETVLPGVPASRRFKSEHGPELATVVRVLLGLAAGVVLLFAVTALQCWKKRHSGGLLGTVGSGSEKS